MNFPQVRLQTSPALIEISTKRGRQSIEQPQAELDIQQPKAELTINRTPSKLTIDQTKAREDVDLKSIGSRIEEAAQLGKQKWLEGIERRVRDGEELMKIENGGNAIANQAKRNGSKPIYEYNVGWVPHHGSVSIDYQPGNVEVNVKINKPVMNNRANKPIVSYEPGEVEIRLKQYNSLNVDFDNLKFVGTNYEQTI
ncbi:DUF6470 family protein [Peribacillus glennii]|uniref:YviE n=1 Tax=Peribacillus glennii TaxID=2303991 RepID=A0A372LE13_9BACI|nr:DUF6470 family protein [Peribacillus glennii]RFU63948.1 hypothetical protein D0466_10900 [Peribacillus glennii]